MKIFRSCIAGLGLMAASMATLAEDIDLFLNAPAVVPGDRPNVILFIDNTANWNTAFAAEKAALISTFNNLPTDASGNPLINVGIMFFGQPALGYVRAGLRPMDAANKSWYADLVNGLDVVTDKGSARTLGRTMSEIYRYLTGDTTVEPLPNRFDNGENQWRDYQGNVNAPAATAAVHALGSNPLGPNTTVGPKTIPDYTYDSPLIPNSCAKTYIIYIGNTTAGGNVTSDNAARNNAAGAELALAGGDTTQLPLVNISHQDNYADEWARFMHEDLGVVVYTVDVNPTTNPVLVPGDPPGQNGGMGNSELLNSMAVVSGGEYFRVSTGGGATGVTGILANIFDQIQSSDSVFASVALPASATGQSIFLNQVFIGLFRPDGGAKPKWPGNLKQYQLGQTAGVVSLRDADNAAAISSGATRFIKDCARSFWTPTATDTYWNFIPAGIGGCAAVPFSDISNYPDGPVVEKGAHAYVLRTIDPITRTMYTCNPTHTSCTTRTNFNIANAAITGTLLDIPAAAPAGSREELINWARGQDVRDVDGDGNSTTEMRPWSHNDIIHSRPVALNYGTDASPEVVVFYGANDGALRAINGNQTGNVASVVPGGEIWSFMPPEFWDKLRRLAINTDTIKFPATGTNAGATGTLKDYGMDGSVTAYEGDIGGSPNQKYIYATMRRGGRSVYAFNVTTENNPTLAWKRGCQGATCSPDVGLLSWTDIGDTWSPASLTTRNDGTPVPLPIILMGGGYDDCEDFDGGVSPSQQPNHNCTAADNGNNIYVIDAATGDLLNVFPTERPVPGKVTAVPVSDVDRNISFAYAADTGGNVYRISGPLVLGSPTAIGISPPSTWVMEKIASFGCGADASSSCTANRKFLFGPDVVRSAVNSDWFRILVGSGDREKPLRQYESTLAVQNYFFSFLDKPLEAAWMDDDLAATCGADVLCRGRLDNISAVTATPGTLTSAHGYYLDMAAGEQVVTEALVINDTANFSTHIPHTPVVGSCESTLGTATTYNIDYQDASGQTINIIGGGLVPTPVAGKVIIDGDPYPFCIGCGAENSPIGGGGFPPPYTYEAPKGRAYWKVEE